MHYTRRDVARIAAASMPLVRAFAAPKIDSKINGVQVGAITYSFNRIANPDPEAIIRAYVDIGLGEAELMSNHCEALAGAPPMMMFPRPAGPGGRGPGGPGAAGRPQGPRPQLTPEQIEQMKAAQAKVAEWRKSTGPNTWKAVGRSSAMPA